MSLLIELIIIPYGEGKGIPLLIRYFRIFPFAELMGFSQNMFFYLTYASLFALLTQFEFRYNPFNGSNKRTFQVIQMISSSAPPPRLVFKNEEFKRYDNIATIGLKLIKFHKKLLYTFLFLVVTICLVNSPLSVPFSIFNALLFMLWTIIIVHISDTIFLTILFNWVYFQLKTN